MAALYKRARLPTSAACCVKFPSLSRWLRRWRKSRRPDQTGFTRSSSTAGDAQVHIEDGAATLYSKNGADITRRFRSLRPALARVPVKSAIVDCELVACDETGMPSFRSLMNLGNKAPALCLWCFDLLSLDGARITPLPLVERRALLSDVIKATEDRAPAVLRRVRRSARSCFRRARK